MRFLHAGSCFRTPWVQPHATAANTRNQKDGSSGSVYPVYELVRHAYMAIHVVQRYLRSELSKV